MPSNLTLTPVATVPFEALPSPSGHPTEARPGPGFPPQVGELLPDLCGRQDAPDGSPHRVWVALALPSLWVLPSRRGVRVVALATMVHSPFLHAVPVVSHAFRRR